MAFKKVYSSFNTQEIALIKSLLEESNIEYNVTNEWSGGMIFHATGMDVMVPEDKAEEAKKIIGDFKDKTKE